MKSLFVVIKKHPITSGMIGLLLLAITLYGVGSLHYLYWHNADDKEVGKYDVFNGSIQIALGLLNIITIGFLALNYWIQRKEIEKKDVEFEENKKDVDYNRAIDLVYRQTSLSREKFKEIGDTTILEGISINFISKDYSKYPIIYWVFQTLKTEMQICSLFLETSTLSEAQRNKLMQTLFLNFNSRATDVVRSFRQSLRNYILHQFDLTGELPLDGLAEIKDSFKEHTTNQETTRFFNSMVDYYSEIEILISKFKIEMSLKVE
ncbi:hypothetical protein ACFSQ3_11955 [Sphingobacterium corticis]|uniref:Phage abortive infection protein n=1 Tax=Sphingobacterium corticis TaxID=1812823 RepID=A0ABW5NKN9_9SPHI